MKKNKLLLIGASGHGRVVADVAMKMGKWDQIAFLDDDKTIKSTMGIEVIGNLTEAFNYINDCDFFVAIGNNKVREGIQDKLRLANANISTLIHPSAIIGESVEVGIGTVIMAGAIINCCSRIGNGCIVNTGATIDHDNVIESYVHISPGSHIAGTVKIGKGTWVGIGSVVSNNVNITSDCMIGAGAVVVKDITETGIYIGIPARRLLNG